MNAQGYPLKSNVLWKDNEGADRMAKNGKLSCSNKSRHITIKYFWIMDRVKQGNLDVRHYPTDVILADFFTKPLQGKKFHIFRWVIMGWDHVIVLKAYIEKDDGLSMKEPVGNNGNETSDVKKLIDEPSEINRKISWAQVVKGES